MSWIDRLKNRVKSITKRDTPDNLWHKCRGCGTLVFRKDFVAAQSVCHACGFHERIGPAERFALLFDDGAHERITIPATPDDPLRFKDSKKYADRLKEARSNTSETDAFAVAVGRIGGVETVVAVQNFAFMAGSMGVGVGEAFLKAAETAVALKAPLVAFTAAGGARMQEGILSLMQMPRTSIAISDLKAAKLPYIVVLTDPTTGGVTASYAMLGDVHFAEPGALIGFAGPRVIENTIREKLPDGFQRSEYLYDHGMVDAVVHRADLRSRLATLLSLLLRRPASYTSLPAPATP